jgi:hypothetical protein
VGPLNIPHKIPILNLGDQVSESLYSHSFLFITITPSFFFTQLNSFINNHFYLFLSLLSLSCSQKMSTEMEETRSNMKPQATQTQLPPRRGLVKIRVIKSLVKSATAFASLSGDVGRKNSIGNGSEDGEHSPSSSPPIPRGYNSDHNNWSLVFLLMFPIMSLQRVFFCLYVWGFFYIVFLWNRKGKKTVDDNVTL